MIGVIASPSEHVVVREFFELFKTPWEFYQSNREYEVLLCSGDAKLPDRLPRLVLIYSGHKLLFDEQSEIQIASEQVESRILSCRQMRIPVYGRSIIFGEKKRQDPGNESFDQSAIHLSDWKGGILARIGYDLFCEVRTLLTMGQPKVNAGIPTLELHIAVLRDLIIRNGLPLVEIPPVPNGHQFIACLTHDIDHPSIRQHKLDHTILGFVYRAIVGSVAGVLRRRRPMGHVLRNWIAVLKLPLVYLGLAKDIWSEFDRYPQFERGLSSTFFVIPFKDDPGRIGQRPGPKRRASRYGATDILGHIQTLKSAGCEIGLHGIDAWHDSSKGRAEVEHIRRIAGTQDIGVRIHWLFQNQNSPAAVEEAGADYDSTVGYNETIGYRAGTTQSYKPLLTTHMLELPLNIMDTALFYPSHLNLSPREARKQVDNIVENAVRFGGCVTVNWHDRSIAPERLWGDFYLDLVDRLKNRGAWFATASQAVSWFRKRRSVVFESAKGDPVTLDLRIPEGGDQLPGLQLRTHRRDGSHQDTEINAMRQRQVLMAL